MRINFLLFGVLSAFSGLAQQVGLQGTYGASFIGGESITFTGRDSFYFQGFYCTEGVYGKGRCAIRKDRLYLYFEKAKPKPPAPHRAAEIQADSTGDSLARIEVFCRTEEDTAIAFASVLLQRPGKVPLGMAADTAGRALLTARKEWFPLTIQTSAVGVESAQIRLTHFADYSIRIFHRPYPLNSELNRGEVYIYEIDELSEDLILMRPAGSRERFRRYERLEARGNQ